jgi:hypothetical protein
MQSKLIAALIAAAIALVAVAIAIRVRPLRKLVFDGYVSPPHIVGKV